MIGVRLWILRCRRPALAFSGRPDLRDISSWMRNRSGLSLLWCRRLCCVLPEHRDHAKPVAFGGARSRIAIPDCSERNPRSTGSGRDRGRRHCSGRSLFRARGAGPSHFGDAAELCLEPARGTDAAVMARADPVRRSRRGAGPRPDPRAQ